MLLICSLNMQFSYFDVFSAWKLFYLERLRLLSDINLNFTDPFRCMQEQSSLVEVFVRRCSLNPVNLLYGALVPRMLGLSIIKINYLSALKITLALVEYLKDSTNLNEESLGEVVGIYSVNRYECMIAEYAMYILRRKSCVLYTKEKSENTKHVMKETKMKTCFMSAECAGLFVEKKLFDDSVKLKNVILLDDLKLESVRNEFEKREIKLHRFSEIKDRNTGFTKLPSVKSALKLKSNSKRGREPDDIFNDTIEYIKSIGLTLPERDDVATICYTSGTTGLPKGAMLTHSNFLAIIDSFDSDLELIQPKETDVYFSYLPMAHVFERTVTTLLVSRGSSIWFGRGKRELFAEDMKKIRPTILAVVPKVLQKITENVYRKIQSSYLLKYIHNKYPGAVMNFIRKMKLGTERLRVCVCGSAYLSPDLCRKAQEILGCRVLQGYGMTETTAGVFIRALECDVVDTVGKPLKNVEVKLVRPERGDFDECFEGEEIFVRGGTVFKGYYENEKATSDAFDEDGWFRTGDIASVDEQGHYRIMDRNSNIVKLSNGEFVQLERLEALFAVEDANDTFVFKAQNDSGVHAALFSEDSNLSKKLEEKVEMLCKKGEIQFYERPQRIFVVSEKILGERIENFCTPTGKKKRKALLERLRDLGLVESTKEN
eukprot:jgi/Antlo1/1835/1901